MTDDHLKRACSEIISEYERRRDAPRSSPGAASRESRHRHYERMLKRAGLLPLTGKRILDAGCYHGGWLERCCFEFGAEPRLCFGVDVFPDGIETWKREHPGSPITLEQRPSHELGFEDSYFDLVHQSMMFSSITDRRLRELTAAELWRVLRLGGCLVWYDFWINPLNPKTVPMRLSEVKSLFPAATIVHRKTITLAPPLARLLSRFADGLVPWLERLRLLNTHHLIVMNKCQ